MAIWRSTNQRMNSFTPTWAGKISSLQLMTSSHHSLPECVGKQDLYTAKEEFGGSSSYLWKKFRSAESEYKSEYVAELTTLCQYGTHLWEALWDHLVCGIQDILIQKKVLTVEHLTLAKTIDIAQEAVEKPGRRLKQLWILLPNLSLSHVIDVVTPHMTRKHTCQLSLIIRDSPWNWISPWKCLFCPWNHCGYWEKNHFLLVLTSSVTPTTNNSCWYGIRVSKKPKRASRWRSEWIWGKN